jgi:ACS family sodium-dependent inorganic phosphate cotransporter
MSQTHSLGRLSRQAWPVRYSIAGLCFLACFICFIDRVNISVAAITMQETFGWSNTTKGFVLSSFFIGYLLFQIPGGWLANRFGGTTTLGLALVSWSAFTLLTPFAAAIALPVLYAARIGMGLGEAVTFPAAYSLFSRWALPGERTRFVALFVSGIPAGTLFALLTSGWFMAHYGWQSVFYAFGAVGLIFAAAWFVFVRNDPREHPKLSAGERALFDAQTPHKAERLKTPWGRFFSLPAIWALIINHFCSNWSFYVLLSWLPSYFRKSFNVSIASAGILSSGPWLAVFVMMHVSAFVSDGLIRRGMSVTHVRKLIQISGLLLTAGFLSTAPLAQSTTVALLVMCAAAAGLGLTCSGFAANHLDIAPRYAALLIGITSAAGTLPGIVGVAVTGWLVDRTGSFNAPLMLSAVIALIGAGVWLIFARGETLVE